LSRLTTRDYKKTSSRSLDPGRWRDFAAGVLVGAVLVAALVGVSHRAEHAAPEVPRPEPHRAPAVDAPAETGADGSQTYDFYQMLPHFEVVVPEKERDVKRDVPAANIERPGVYVLQAGSYRSESDADRVAKQLSLQGIEAKVQRVAVDADVWYRVRVGPISQLPELNKVRHKLQAADIDAIVIRVGD